MKKVDKKLTLQSNKWNFDGEVNKYFDSHVKRSVPLYTETHKLVCSFSDYFINEGSTIYDIGCSTGTLIQKIAKRHKDVKNLNPIGLDISQNMINHSKTKNKYNNAKYFKRDITKVKFKKSSMIVSMYTIQFISPKHRQDLINKIYDCLDWGAGFLLFEKVRGSDARFQEMMQNVYIDYKIDNNFSSNEIINKSRSLKGVLEPFSREGNLGLLKRAGFEDIETIFRFNCFEGYMAIK
tara:strand:+ start:651 stop:1361 length:711 start_codon:yes stop_codon:yes gene_type:complete